MKRPSWLALWLLAIRPKTLLVSLSPVILGTALAAPAGELSPSTFLFTLASALGLQMAVNLHNDVEDYLRGADTPHRKGPRRATQGGLVSPRTMRWAFTLTLLAACTTGGVLVSRGGMPILLIGAASVIALYLYTGGKTPLGYLGWGDLLVFLFFGPIATLGTTYLQAERWELSALLAGISLGLLAMAILTINNLRDVEEDRRANKKTLVVRFGKRFGQSEYILSLAGGLYLPLFWLPPLQKIFYAGTLLFLLPIFFRLLGGLSKEGEKLNPLLGKTASFLFLWSLDTALICLL